MEWGTFDVSELKKLQEKINKLASSDIQKFMEECAKDLAARLLRYVKMRTPVGKYPKGSGKVGGTLRRGWYASGQSPTTSSAVTADGVQVSYSGGVYIVEIVNPTEYASYVEYGHRTTSGGWVPGRFMLKISEDELKDVIPQILEDKIMKFLGNL